MTREAVEGIVSEYCEQLREACGGDPPLPDFLDWLYTRLVNVYGESENLDFVRACSRRAENLRAALAAESS